MTIARSLARIPMPAIMLGGGVAGAGAAVLAREPLTEAFGGDENKDARFLSGLAVGVGGLAIASLGQMAAWKMHFKGQTPNQRFFVDAAEQVTVKWMNRDMSLGAAWLGATAAGGGLGMMFSPFD